jgi:hypothetical protein
MDSTASMCARADTQDPVTSSDPSGDADSKQRRTARLKNTSGVALIALSLTLSKGAGGSQIMPLEADPRRAEP